MRVCNKCLLSSRHSFGPTICESGICVACGAYNHPCGNLDDLKEKLSKSKSKIYDCVIVLRGTPEDYFVVGKILQLGMYPLCVFVNSYFSNDIAWNNIHNLIHKYDLELRCFNPNPQHYKLLVKYTLRRFYDILTPHKLMTFRYTMDLAQSLNINYVISGENQVAQNSAKFLAQKIPQHTAWSVLEHDAHTTASDFFGPSLELRQAIKNQYNPLKSTNSSTSWLFLSDFIAWDQLQQDADALRDGALGQLESTTFDFCHRAGSSVFYKFQDLLRFHKTGTLKATEQLSREIRAGRVDLQSALIWNGKFVNETLNPDRLHSTASSFFSWLGLGEEAVRWIKRHHLPTPKSEPGFAAGEQMRLYCSLLNTDQQTISPSIRVPNKEYCVFEKGAHI